MKSHFKQIWTDERGVLSFEWTLLLTLLVIGIVGGLAAARDAIIDELADIAQAAVCIDQSFSIAPDPCFGIGGLVCIDEMPVVDRCERTDQPVGQEAPQGP